MVRVAADDGWLVDGDVAEVVLVAASTDNDVGLFEVEPNQPVVRREQVASMDLTGDCPWCPAAWEAASGGGALAEHAATAKVYCCEAFQAITAFTDRR